MMITKVAFTISIFLAMVALGLLETSFVLPSIPVQSAEGIVTSIGTCQISCLTETCGYVGNVDVQFIWNNITYAESVLAQGFCGLDCCQSLVETERHIHILINLLASGYPSAYDCSLYPPSVPGNESMWFLGFGLACLILSLVGFVVACKCRTTAQYSRLPSATNDIAIS